MKATLALTLQCCMPGTHSLPGCILETGGEVENVLPDKKKQQYVLWY